MEGKDQFVVICLSNGLIGLNLPTLAPSEVKFESKCWRRG